MRKTKLGHYQTIWQIEPRRALDANISITLSALLGINENFSDTAS